MQTSMWTATGKWRYRYILSKNRKYDWIEFKHQGESYFAWGIVSDVDGKWQWYPVDDDCNIIGPPVDDGVGGDEWWMWFVYHGQRPLPEGLI